MIWYPKKNYNKKIQDEWNEKFKIAEKYYLEYGNLNTTGSLEYSNMKLGSWIGRMRSYYNKGKLSEYQIEKLNSINMQWNLPTDDDIWMKNYNILIKYCSNFGDINNITSNEYYCDIKIGQWLKLQRYLHNKGRLKEDRKEKLNNLGIKWSQKDKSILNLKCNAKGKVRV